MEKKKNQFFRTIAGKSVLFLLINIALFAVFLCTCTAFVCINEDLYGRTEAQYVRDRSESDLYYYVLNDANSLMNGNRSSKDIIPLRITDKSGKVLASTPDFDDVAKAAGTQGEYENAVLYSYKLKIVYNEEGYVEGFFTDYSDDSKVVDATIEAYADPSDYSPFSEFELQVIRLAINLRYLVYPVAIVFILIGIAAFIALMCAAGMRPGKEEAVLGPMGKVPFDVLAAVTLTVTVPLFMFVGAADRYFAAVVFAVALFTFVNSMLGLSVSLAARVKLHMLIKGTLVYKLIRLMIKGILAIPLVWKTILILTGISIVELITVVASDGDQATLVIALIMSKIIFYPFLLYIAFMLKKLKLAGDRLAAGDITYRASTKGLWGDFRKHANNLNAVSDSVTIAVEDRLKSERMKTELITNVSHDIKTPLTSIINYASLMGTADPSDPKMSEYSEVVVRQSEKLKRLIEDLVEASKASTGNLEIEPAPLDCCTFISQTAGEYKEKLDSCNLTLVTSAPEEKVMIMADGRRMMRIYDNLMNNICKYSQPGTRVYLTLETANGKAVTTFKNISVSELNISADELVERFVRGDQSRNTEGNGLGLSIAKSLTELQGGSFDISIDGDLFKVTLVFPLIA
ncbi:MAG: HAMP domain-containing histidine kinase [Saccharofermentans sp.]|nr:HAMP domain-containing histidine kinase [Saccharofermentans sp.]